MKFKVCDFPEGYIKRLRRRLYFFMVFVVISSLLCAILDSATDKIEHSYRVDFSVLFMEGAIMLLIFSIVIGGGFYLLDRFIDYDGYYHRFEISGGLLVRKSSRSKKEKSISLNQIRKVQLSRFSGVHNIEEDGRMLHSVMLYYAPRYLPWMRVRMMVKLGVPSTCREFGEELSKELNVPLRKVWHPDFYFFSRSA